MMRRAVQAVRACAPPAVLPGRDVSAAVSSSPAPSLPSTALSARSVDRHHLPMLAVAVGERASDDIGKNVRALSISFLPT